MLKKRLSFIAIFFFLLTFVNAQESGVDIFDRFIITPPGPPEEPSKFDLFFELKDYDSKELINDIHVYITILENGIETNMLQYVADDAIVKLKLNPGKYTIKLKVDELDTLGKDYFFESDFNINARINQTIYLFPIGSLRGFVYVGDKAINSANLKFECSASYGETNSLETDSFGSFSSEWLPVGLCRVSAEYGRKIGFKDVVIKKGEISDVEIMLSKNVLSSSYSGFLIIILLAIVIILVYFYNKRKKVVVKETKAELSSRTKDIINTLKEKEREVVNFLLKNNHVSTQARIRNNTSIPKTSLARLFVGLEAKNIISIEKIGKMKKIRLTNWFLGKK